MRCPLIFKLNNLMLFFCCLCLEGVSDFCKELNFFGRLRCRCGFFLLALLKLLANAALKCIDSLKHNEKDDSHDKEVDDGC